MKNAYAGYMLTSFFYTYLQALRSLFKMRIFFLPKSEQSCFLSQVCALHHYCVHQCRIAQFVYAKGTSSQVKSIDKKCLFFTQLLLHSINIAISMSSGIFVFFHFLLCTIFQYGCSLLLIIFNKADYSNTMNMLWKTPEQLP